RGRVLGRQVQRPFPGMVVRTEREHGQLALAGPFGKIVLQGAIPWKHAIESLVADGPRVWLPGKLFKTELLRDTQAELLWKARSSLGQVLRDDGVGVGPLERMFTGFDCELARATEGDVAALQRDGAVARLQHDFGLGQDINALV